MGVEGLEWGGWSWGLRLGFKGSMWGFRKILHQFAIFTYFPFVPLLLSFLPCHFYLCHFYLCHFYRCHFYTPNHIYFMKKNSGEYLNSFKIVSIFLH